MKNNDRNRFNNQKGQALVFVIATLTVAMSVAVGVTLRNLASISRTTRLDTSSRAQAAAEGGAENVLARSDAELDAIIAGGGTTTVDFTPDVASQDNISLVAEVTVEPYTGESGLYPLTIRAGEAKEVRIYSGASAKICWNSSDPAYLSDLHLTLFDSNGTGNLEKYIVKAAGDGRPYPPGAPNYETNGETTLAELGYENCHNVTMGADQDRVRVRALIADVDLTVVADSDPLPTQGYKISSVGRLKDFAEGAEAESVVKVTVIRSFSYAPSLFDFGLYSGADALLDLTN
jgi:hypothetical protein